MLAAALASILAGMALQDPGSALLEPVEIRALVVRPSDLEVLATPSVLGEAMQRVSAIGFDAVVPVVREKGRALSPSPALAAAGLADAPAFPGRDVLGEIVFEAHRAGLEVLVGIDGAWTIDPAAAPPRGLALAPGSEDRLDPRDAAVRALARAYALEIARSNEIDGIVLWNGLTARAADALRDAAAGKAQAEAAAELAAWREELRAVDKPLVVGWAGVDPRFELPADGTALDFVALPPGRSDVGAALSQWMGAQPGRAAAWHALDDATTAEAFAAGLAAARVRPWSGEILGTFAALHARENLLADVLDQGIEAPYYARATLPWRGGVAWRPVVEWVEISNDSGTFEDVDSEIPYSTLAAGQRGNASWSLKPAEKGPHDLWVWLQPGEAEVPALEFTIPTDPRRVQRVVLPAHVPRGWTRVARTAFSSNRKEDVLRLEVAEGGRQAIAIGPLVALPSRRAGNR